ncbi:MAG: sugar ABC transporter ATP-binding protein, partial [Xanthobacteraceae bacterium]
SQREVHGLVGENGAGKSTLIKHLTGLYTADSGSIQLFGRALENARAHTLQQAGIGVIYQERAILPELTAAANVFLGRQKTWGPFLDRGASIRRFRELADRLGVALDPDVRAGSLSVAGQQLLEIMRALEAEHRILIMDEPATSLGEAEREKLYDIVDGLRHQGLCIIFISHDLDDVLRLCDRVSVMRDGALVATKPATDWDKATLVAAMLGDVDFNQSIARRPPVAAEELRIEGLSIAGVVSDVSFAVRAGEIFGLAGLVGAGRTEILRVLAGIDRPSAGRLFLRGREINWPRSVARALGYGIALTPEDRKSQGLILRLSGAQNVALADLGSVSTYGILSDRRLRREAADSMAALAFDTARLGDPAGNLSGGNQQKLVIGKWLHRKPSILLLDEPTQGIDVGAKAEIYKVISELANQGMAVILVSSQFEEIVDVCDRALMLGGGRSLGLLGREQLSIKAIFDRLFHAGIAA